MNVRTLSMGQWVKVLTEDGLTMEVVADQTVISLYLYLVTYVGDRQF